MNEIHTQGKRFFSSDVEKLLLSELSTYSDRVHRATCHYHVFSTFRDL